MLIYSIFVLLALQSGPKDVLGMCIRMFRSDGSTVYAYCTTHMVANMWTSKLKHIITVHHAIRHVL